MLPQYAVLWIRCMAVAVLYRREWRWFIFWAVKSRASWRMAIFTPVLPRRRRQLAVWTQRSASSTAPHVFILGSSSAREQPGSYK